MPHSILSKIADEYTCPIAVMVRDGKLLTGQRNYTKDKYKEVSVWTMPGGRCDPGESIEQTLRREVYEEVGITTFEIVDYIGEAPGAKEGDTVALFLCTTSESATLMEPEKFSEWRWVDTDDYFTNYAGFNPYAQKLIKEHLDRAVL